MIHGLTCHHAVPTAAPTKRDMVFSRDTLRAILLCQIIGMDTGLIKTLWPHLFRHGKSCFGLIKVEKHLTVENIKDFGRHVNQFPSEANGLLQRFQQPTLQQLLGSCV